MTANVRIVTDQKDDVLKVPNAALRFRPPGIEAEQRERPAGGGPGGGGQRTGGGTGPRGGGGPGGREGGARASVTRGRVWVLDAAGKPKAVQIQLGISDGTSTEVTGGELTEQQQVLVGVGGDRGAGGRQHRRAASQAVTWRTS